MITAKKQILLLDNQGRGAIKEFPAAFPLPERHAVSTKDEPIYYHRTNKIRKVNGQDAVIYTQNSFRLNLDDYATGDATDEHIRAAIPDRVLYAKAQTQETPTAGRVSLPGGSDTHFSLEIKKDAEKGSYSATIGVGSEFNRQFVEDVADNDFLAIKELLDDVFLDLRLKAKKKAQGYIEDTMEIEL